jgi:hypothetical protein
MIDLSKITFVERDEMGRANIKTGIELHCSAFADSRISKTEIHNYLRRMLWEKIYGDLRGPIQELLYLTRHDRLDPRAVRLIDEILGMLRPPEV